jgi:hypothetical protein
VIDYAVNSIQNGSPDGIALVDASNVVVEFLSYEGTLTGQPIGEPVGLVDESVWFNAREPIAQTFVKDGDRFTVIANHFKSVRRQRRRLSDRGAWNRRSQRRSRRQPTPTGGARVLTNRLVSADLFSEDRVCCPRQRRPTTKKASGTCACTRRSPIPGAFRHRRGRLSRPAGPTRTASPPYRPTARNQSP